MEKNNSLNALPHWW